MATEYSADHPLAKAAPSMLEACTEVWCELADADDPRLKALAEMCRRAAGLALEEIENY